jgi:hypothetical protein
MKNFLIVFSLVLLGLVTSSMAQPPPQIPLPPWETPPILYPFPIECYEVQVGGLTMTYCFYINPFTIPPTYVITSYGVNQSIDEYDDRWFELRKEAVEAASNIQGMELCHQNPGQRIEDAVIENIPCYMYAVSIPFGAWAAKQPCPGTENKCKIHFCYDCSPEGEMVWKGNRGAESVVRKPCEAQGSSCHSDCSDRFPYGQYDPNAPCE